MRHCESTLAAIVMATPAAAAPHSHTEAEVSACRLHVVGSLSACRLHVVCKFLHVVCDEVESNITSFFVVHEGVRARNKMKRCMTLALRERKLGCESESFDYETFAFENLKFS